MTTRQRDFSQECELLFTKKVRQGLQQTKHTDLTKETKERQSNAGRERQTERETGGLK